MSSRTLAELAELCGAELDGDGGRVVDGPAALASAGPREVSFLAQPKYRAQLAGTRAAGVVVAHDVEKPRADLALLRCADPNAAFTRIVGAFAADEPPPAPGVHPLASIDPRAVLGAGVSIGPFAVVGPGARIGDRAVLVGSLTVGRDAVVGADSVLHPGVVVYPRCVVGARCLLHAGVVIGADGFGFDPPRDARGWVKIPQCGHVEIGDEVEIGANSTIDRGRFGATRIGRGVKLDNLVHVGHNVVVADGVLIVAQTGIAGSTTIGAYAVLGGQVGVAGHVDIGARARIASQAGVFGDVPAGEEWLGFPARPRREALRTLASANKVPELAERVRALERRLAGLVPEAEPDPVETERNSG